MATPQHPRRIVHAASHPSPRSVTLPYAHASCSVDPTPRGEVGVRRGSNKGRRHSTAIHQQHHPLSRLFTSLHRYALGSMREPLKRRVGMCMYLCLCVLRAKPSIKGGVSFLLNRQPTEKMQLCLRTLSRPMRTLQYLYTIIISYACVSRQLLVTLKGCPVQRNSGRNSPQRPAAEKPTRSKA